MSDKVLVVCVLVTAGWACAGGAWAQEPAAPPPIPDAAAQAAQAAVQARPSSALTEEVTLFKMIQWGGVILWVLIAMGFAALVMSIYFLLTVTPKREVPPNLAHRLVNQIRAGDLRGAYQLCEGRDEMLANVIRAGLRMSGHDRYVIQDAMESEGERGVMTLWQKIFYLNNIGVVAPLVGLLGTVWGMVLAFASIASDNAQVKSMAVASAVSKAMICTVGGLVVAIPSLAVYYFLRGRVVKIIAAVEAQASEVVELLSRGKQS
jgi:biopolymer transport protein ExbB